MQELFCDSGGLGNPKIGCLSFLETSADSGFVAYSRSDLDGHLVIASMCLKPPKIDYKVLFSEVMLSLSYRLITSLDWLRLDALHEDRISNEASEFHSSLTVGSLLSIGLSDGSVVFVHVTDGVLMYPVLKTVSSDRVVCSRIFAGSEIGVLHADGVLTLIPLTSVLEYPNDQSKSILSRTIKLQLPGRCISMEYLGKIIHSDLFQDSPGIICFGEFFSASFKLDPFVYPRRPQNKSSFTIINIYSSVKKFLLTDSQHPMTLTCTNLSLSTIFPTRTILDENREALQVARLDDMAIIADSLGRLSLLWMPGLVILKMLKGYRDSSVFWSVGGGLGIYCPLKSQLEIWTGDECTMNFLIDQNVRKVWGLFGGRVVWTDGGKFLLICDHGDSSDVHHKQMITFPGKLIKYLENRLSKEEFISGLTSESAAGSAMGKFVVKFVEKFPAHKESIRDRIVEFMNDDQNVQHGMTSDDHPILEICSAIDFKQTCIFIRESCDPHLFGKLVYNRLSGGLDKDLDTLLLYSDDKSETYQIVLSVMLDRLVAVVHYLADDHNDLHGILFSCLGKDQLFYFLNRRVDSKGEDLIDRYGPGQVLLSIRALAKHPFIIEQSNESVTEWNAIQIGTLAESLSTSIAQELCKRETGVDRDD